MSQLLEEGWRGKITLIYIDPPFYSQNSYATYSDKWKSLDDYLGYMKPRIELIRELLADNGTFYLHCDWHASHYLKVICDEIFEYENFRNEIVWQRDAVGKGAKKTSYQWSRELDSILFYSKGNGVIFNQQYKEDLTHIQLKEFRYRDPDGRRFKIVNIGDYTQESIAKLEREGLIYTSSTGKIYKKYYLDEFSLAIGSLWDDIPNISHGINPERLDFPTQKPEALLNRIILASSNEGDIVADFFCGSGTTLAVAEKLNRRWIGCDISEDAIEVTKRRLESIGGLFSNVGDSYDVTLEREILQKVEDTYING